MTTPAIDSEAFADLVEGMAGIPVRFRPDFDSAPTGGALDRYFAGLTGRSAVHQPDEEGAVANGRSAAWARSGRSPRPGVSARPVGSWAVAVERARAEWDGLTGGASAPAGTASGSAYRAVYSDAAAAAILRTAVALWPSVAAELVERDGGQ